MEDITRSDIRMNIKEHIEKKYSCMNMKELGGYQNFVYEGAIDKKKYIFRISHISHRSKLELREEIRFLNLLKENDVPIAKPVQLLSYEYVDKMESNDGVYLLCIFEKAKGLTWEEKDIGENDQNYFNAGKALGKIHYISKNIKKRYTRKQWFENQYLQIAKSVLQDIEVINGLIDFIKELKKLPRDEESYGLIHGDYLYGNMVYDNEKITVIDFDECEYNWFIYDIAVYLFYYFLGGDPKNMDIESNIELFKQFMVGYNQENKLDMFWIEKMPIFLRLREFVLLSSIYRSFYPDKLGQWQTDYIEASEFRIKNNIPFVKIDFKKIYKDI